MHKLIVVLAFLAASSAPAQQPAAPAPPPAGSNWQRVQALPVGQSIDVTAKASHANCKLKSVDADTLTCTQRKDIVFQRADILSVKVPRRGRSALIGTAIGAGAGAVFGFASGRNGSFVPRGLGAAIFGVVGAPIGAAIGALTDFNHSTVYKAP
jgi:hypothetical protein